MATLKDLALSGEVRIPYWQGTSTGSDTIVAEEPLKTSKWKTALANIWAGLSGKVQLTTKDFGSNDPYNDGSDYNDGTGRFVSNMDTVNRFHLGNEFGSGANSQVFIDGFEDPTHLTFKVEFGEWGAAINDNETIASIQRSSMATNTLFMDYDCFPMGLLDLNFVTPTSLKFNELTQYNAYNWLSSRNEDRRAQYLREFIWGLYDVQRSMPYIFNKISGLDKLTDLDSTRGQRLKDVTLTLTCLPDGIDLKMRTLMELYRKAAWNDIYQRWELPDIYRYFKMIIYIFDDRSLHMGSGLFSPDQDAFPIIALECGPCEFIIKNHNLQEYTLNYQDVKDNEVSIDIKVLNVKTLEANQMFKNVKYVNDIITESEHWAQEDANATRVNGQSINWKYVWMQRQFMMPDEYNAYYRPTEEWDALSHYFADENDDAQFPLNYATIEMPDNSWHLATVTDHGYVINSWSSLWNAVKSIITANTTLIRDSRQSDRYYFRNDLEHLNSDTFQYFAQQNLIDIDIKSAKRDMRLYIRKLLNQLKDFKMLYDTEHTLKTVDSSIDLNIEKPIEEFSLIEYNLDKMSLIIDTSLYSFKIPSMILNDIDINDDKLDLNLSKLILNLVKIKQDLVEIEPNLEQLEEELIPLNINLEQAEQELTSISKNLSIIKQGLIEINKNLLKPDMELEVIEKNVKQLEQSLASLLLNIETPDMDMQEIDINLDKLKQRLQKLLINLDKQFEAMTFIDKNLDKPDEELAFLRLNLLKISQSLIYLLINDDKKLQHLIDINKNLNKPAEELIEIDKNLEKESENMTEIDKNLEKQSEELTKLIINLEKQTGEMTELDINNEHSNTEISTKLIINDSVNDNMEMTETELNVEKNDDMKMNTLDSAVLSDEQSSMNRIDIDIHKSEMSDMNAILNNNDSVEQSMTDMLINTDSINLKMSEINKDSSIQSLPMSKIISDTSIAQSQMSELILNSSVSNMSMSPIELNKDKHQSIMTSIDNNDIISDMKMISEDMSVNYEPKTQMNDEIINASRNEDMSMLSIEQNLSKIQNDSMNSIYNVESDDNEFTDVDIVKNLDKNDDMKMNSLQLNLKKFKDLIDVELIHTDVPEDMKMTEIDESIDKTETVKMNKLIIDDSINDKVKMNHIDISDLTITSKDVKMNTLSKNELRTEMKLDDSKIKQTESSDKNPASVMKSIISDKLANRIMNFTNLDLDSLKTASVEQMNTLIGMMEQTVKDVKTEMKMDSVEKNLTKNEMLRDLMTKMVGYKHHNFGDDEIKVDANAFERGLTALRNAQDRMKMNSLRNK